jgi:hypothetical protein
VSQEEFVALLETCVADTLAVMSEAVLRANEVDQENLRALLERIGLRPACVPSGAPIPGSYWGDEEAGLRLDALYYRPDTPLHSILHEACHFACMSSARRGRLDTDAGGDDLEECAVCYLQVLCAHALPQLGADRMLRDMDAWGYTFRLGSARRWFFEDADDARTWLEREGLIDAQQRPTWRLRAGRGGDDT